MATLRKLLSFSEPNSPFKGYPGERCTEVSKVHPRKSYTMRQKLEVLAELQRSKLTVAQFCRVKGHNACNVIRWREEKEVMLCHGKRHQRRHVSILVYIFYASLSTVLRPLKSGQSFR